MDLDRENNLLLQTEALLHDAQEVVELIAELARKLRVRAAVSSVPDAGSVRRPWRPIISAVAFENGMGIDALLRGRRRDYINARTELYRKLRAEGYSYPEIGRFVGREHSTIMHALGVTK